MKLENKIAQLEAELKDLKRQIIPKQKRPMISTNCPECGLPYGQCDPEGIGHYRG